MIQLVANSLPTSCFRCPIARLSYLAHPLFQRLKLSWFDGHSW